MERNGQVKGEGREWCFGWKAQQEQSHGADKREWQVIWYCWVLGRGRASGWRDGQMPDWGGLRDLQRASELGE